MEKLIDNPWVPNFVEHVIIMAMLN